MEFTQQELGTILHGLRMYQEQLEPVQAGYGCTGNDISCDHFDDVTPLTASEIDYLCERLTARGPDALAIDKLSQVAEIQQQFWDAAHELEKLLGCEINTLDDLSGYTIEDLRKSGT